MTLVGKPSDLNLPETDIVGLGATSRAGIPDQKTVLNAKSWLGVLLAHQIWKRVLYSRHLFGKARPTLIV